jgi:undecaprenyl diphosphate synthase
MKFQVLPKHVAFIMDGNRRWAKRNKLTAFQGHQKGLERAKEVIDECRRLQLSCVTLWGFSTENWKRSRREVSYLMRLFERYLQGHIDELHKNNVVIFHIGRKDRLPSRLMKILSDAEKLTGKNTGMVLQLAIDYGGRDEILRAVSKISRKRSCSEKDFRVLLDTVGSPDPDLIVRTSGEMRLSGFLIWQGAYSELYFTKKCFPEFTTSELHKAFKEYEKRKRNYGA